MCVGNHVGAFDEGENIVDLVCKKYPHSSVCDTDTATLYIYNI